MVTQGDTKRNGWAGGGTAAGVAILALCLAFGHHRAFAARPEPNSWAGTVTERHREIQDSATFTDARSARKLLLDHYGDLVDSLASVYGSRERALTRLTISYRLFRRGLHHLSDGRIPRGYGPSPAVLARIDSDLPDLPDADGLNEAAYVERLQPRLGRLEDAAYKQVMKDIAEEVKTNEELFRDGRTVEKAERILAEDATARGGLKVSARLNPRELNIPDTPPQQMDSDRASVHGGFVTELSPPRTGGLTGAELATLSNRQLSELIEIARTAPAGSSARAGLGALLEAKAAKEKRDDSAYRAGSGTEAALAAGGSGDETGIVNSRSADTSTASVSDDRSRSEQLDPQLDSPGSGGHKPLWFDAALRNLTDFFQAGTEPDKDDDDEDGEAERVAYDPLTGKKVDPSELDFEDELVQRDRNETVSRRGIDER